MNCPLCGAELEGETVCPNCGEPIIPEQAAVPTARTARETHPGIFYENLLASQEVYEREHQPRKTPRYTAGEKRGMTLCLALLLAILGVVWVYSGRYDPEAQALSGRDGISMDNRTFAIYYQGAMESFAADYDEDTLPFDQTRRLDRQYVDLESGYSWDDYFKAQALSGAALTESLLWEAEARGFTLEGENLSALETHLAALPTLAAACGYQKKDGSGDVEAYLAARFGPAVTEETYRQYLRDSYLAQAYSEELQDSLQASDEALGNYFRALMEETDCRLTRFAGTAKN